MCPANERRGYIVTTSLIGWAHTYTDPCLYALLSSLHCCFEYFVNTLRPRQNGRHFPDNIFKWIFFNENLLISIKISLTFVPKGSIKNISALVQIMALHQSGDKPLSKTMMVILLMHICITRPQWVNHYIAFLIFFFDWTTLWRHLT